MRLILFRGLLLLFAFTSNTVIAQLNDISFQQISPPGGFSLDMIKSIVQDDLGNMWLGLAQGVIQYNSNKSKWIDLPYRDSVNLGNISINQIFCDANNQIWVATTEGLYTFDRREQKFNRISYAYEDGSIIAHNILAISEGDDDKIFIIDEFYFGYLDIHAKQFNRIGKDQIRSPVRLHKDESNNIWIGTSTGDVLRFNPPKDHLEKMISNKSSVNCIFTESSQVWIGTEGEGAKLYHLDGSLIKQIPFKNPKIKESGGHVRVIKRDIRGRLWFGAYEGLFMDDGKNLVRFNPGDFEGLPHSSIYEIFEDKQGSLWIGTYSGGVSLIHSADNNFKTYRHKNQVNSISNNMVSSFLQVSEDELLIGTEVGGLNSFNLTNEEFARVHLSDSMEVTNIKSLCKDRFGGIWVGTYRQGLWYRSLGSTEFQQFKKGPEDGNHISSASVLSLVPVDSGIWIGTNDAGINFYNYKSNAINYCFRNNPNSVNISKISARSLLIDSKANMWIGTSFNFLYKIELNTNRITKIVDQEFAAKYDHVTIHHLWEHSSGDIWIGSKNKGILVFSPDSNKVKSFKSIGALCGKNVYGIIEDQNKRVWITTSNGLILHDPQVGINHRFTFRDGIQGDIFIPKAVYLDSRENLYFGGTNGLTRISPNHIKINQESPKTIINEISTKDNKSIFPTYKKTFEIEPVYLEPQETTFQIYFSSDNYLIPEKNQYKYRMINYRDEWIEIQNEGTVLFTSLDAGKYIFEVKASNNDGLWSESPARMKIVVQDFWYFSKTAYFVYILIAVGLFYLISRFYIEQAKLKRTILFEKNQGVYDELLHETKLKLPTNISHEFRTLLTLISRPIKRLISSEYHTSKQHEESEIVKSNANRPLKLINQVFDFRKPENGKSNLDLKQRRRIYRSFGKQFVSENNLKVSSPDNIFLKRVYEAVEKNIVNKNFGMGALTDELRISRSQLHRKIRMLSGITTSDFVNRVRVNKAVELITKGNYLFCEVAYHVGFANQSYFNKCFKKVYNTTPKKFFEKYSIKEVDLN